MEMIDWATLEGRTGSLVQNEINQAELNRYGFNGISNKIKLKI